jgi:hypothetical protein
MKRSPVRHVAPLLSVALVSALAGCPPRNPLGPPPTVRTVETTATPDAARRARAIVCVRVALVNLPAGAASDSQDIWARLREEVLGPDRQNLLKANGLRAGIAPGRNLVDLVGVLQGLTGRDILYATIPGISEDPRSLTLRGEEPPRTFFIIGQDGSARGVDYPAGEYLLTMAGRIDQNNPSHVLMTVMPQVRVAVGDTRVVRTEGRLTFQTYREVLGLEEGTVTVDMPVGDILVIGPGPQSHRPSSIAHSFLIGQINGIPYEIVILLVPQIASESPR